MVDKALDVLTAAVKPTGTEIVHALQGVNSRGLTVRQITEIGSSVIIDSSTARVLSIGDVGKFIRFTNVGAIVCTINTGIFLQGDEITFEQAGLGAVTFTAGTGFTLGSAGSLITSNGSRAVQGLKFISATEATLFGNLV